jgi:hypothetical protein
MYEAYFTKRLLEALNRAEQAADCDERSVHLQISRHYRDLLEAPDKRDSLRHTTRIAATLRYGTSLRRVTVSDLSTGGFRITLDDPLEPETPVALQLDGFAPTDGLVVWRAGDQLGCKFVRPLHPALVDAAIALGTEP